MTYHHDMMMPPMFIHGYVHPIGCPCHGCTGVLLPCSRPPMADAETQTDFPESGLSPIDDTPPESQSGSCSEVTVDSDRCCFEPIELMFHGFDEDPSFNAFFSGRCMGRQGRNIEAFRREMELGSRKVFFEDDAGGGVTLVRVQGGFDGYLHAAMTRYLHKAAKEVMEGRPKSRCIMATSGSRELFRVFGEC